MRYKTIKKYTICIILGIIVSLIFIKIRAAFFLADADVTIITYNKITEIPTSSEEMTKSIFHYQISDFVVNGIQTTTPKEITNFSSWGFSLPERPILIIFETADKHTINNVAPIIKMYEFKATICIPDFELEQIIEGTNPSLITPTELNQYLESELFNLGLKLTEIPKEIKKVEELSDGMKAIFNIRPDIILFPDNSELEISLYEDICSAADANIGINSAVTNASNPINGKTNLTILKHQRVCGSRMTFSIRAIRHPGAISAGEIYISQPIGDRFSASVSVFDKNYNLIMGEYYDALPNESTLLGKLPKNVDFPISVYITDETGLILYQKAQFNRYSIERGEPVPYEYSQESIDIVSEIEIPLDDVE